MHCLLALRDCELFEFALGPSALVFIIPDISQGQITNSNNEYSQYVIYNTIFGMNIPDYPNTVYLRLSEHLRLDAGRLVFG